MTEISKLRDGTKIGKSKNHDAVDNGGECPNCEMEWLKRLRLKCLIV